MTFKARPGKLSKTKPARLHPGPDLDQAARLKEVERRFSYSFTPRQAPSRPPLRGGPDQVLRQQLEAAQASLALAREHLAEKDEMIHHLSAELYKVKQQIKLLTSKECVT